MNDDCKLFLFIQLQIRMDYRRTAYLDVHHQRIGASHHSPSTIQGPFLRIEILHTLVIATEAIERNEMKNELINLLMNRYKMQGMVRAARWWREAVKTAIWQRTCRRETNGTEKVIVEGGWKGLENISVAEIIVSRKRGGDESIGSWLWCREDDAAIDAVQNVARSVSLVRVSDLER